MCAGALHIQCRIFVSDVISSASGKRHFEGRDKP
jgi:hypothetical protein